METKQYDLTPLWEALLGVYKKFAEICQRHNLRHWVGYGTLLGAVRHHGFIPWDDDFDVIMPRTDFDIFRKIPQEEFGEDYQLINWMKLKGIYPFTFDKLQMTNKKVLDKVQDMSRLAQPQGIYIDIFPLDGIPSSAIQRTWHRIRWNALKLRCKYLFNQGKRTSWGEAVSGILGGFLKPLYQDIVEISDMNRKHEMYARKIPFDESEQCAFYAATLYGKLQNRTISCAYMTNWFKKTEYVDFAGIKVPIPSGWDNYLKVHYGNYLELPPEEKRTLTHIDTEEAPWKYGI